MGAHTGDELLQRGELAAAREAFRAEAEAAEAAGDARAFARAALGRSGLWVHDYRSQLERAEVGACQDRALAGLAHLADAEPLGRRLRLRREAERRYGTDDAASIEALLAQARMVGDEALLADALHLTYLLLLGPRHLQRRLALADELIAVSPTTGRPLDGLLGLAHRALALIELGDRRAGRAVTELRTALAAQECAALGYVLDVFDVLRLAGSGRLDEAAARAEAAHARGAAVGDADADTWHAAQLLAIHWFRGRPADMLAVCEEFIDAVDVAEPAGAGFVAAGGVAAAELGQETLARACLAQLRARCGAVPMSGSWLAALFGIGEIAYALGDVEVAAEVAEAVTPYASLPVIVSNGAVSFGSASRTLGLAAATLGRWDDAVDFLSQALQDDLATGTLVTRPDTQWRLADVLAERGAPGDLEQAAALRETAMAHAEEMGLSGRLQAWRKRWRPGEVSLSRQGEMWRLALGARQVTVPASVGMGHLAELMANPGVDIPAADLVSRYGVREARAEGVLDDRALRAYRARVDELRERLEAADAAGDSTAGARAQDELDALTTELARSTGLRGGARSFADANERARVAVHRAIQRALAAIDRADPQIGRVVRARVTTGVRCRYAASGPLAAGP